LCHLVTHQLLHQPAGASARFIDAPFAPGRWDGTGKRRESTSIHPPPASDLRGGASLPQSQADHHGLGPSHRHEPHLYF
jgi:Bacterial regulatory helix-turn-helix proteins, AraC family